MASKATTPTPEILDDIALFDATLDAAHALLAGCAEQWRAADSDREREPWMSTIRQLRTATAALDPADRVTLRKHLLHWSAQAAELADNDD
ncbi:hypothetical protein ABIB25_000980 [Nakamurella sp. UYEF19]|uniref:hypothetical protein n=1 Tax=Nakamurella sp. UYEF19 TaxID=1756392 RepID=UPI003398C92D